MTAYFSQFPKIKYNGVDITDITIRLSVFKNIKESLVAFQHINIKGGERPEDIANKYYGNPELFWVIMIVNDIVDPYADWPMEDNYLYSLVSEKYGEHNEHAVHHYETTEDSDYGEGVVVNAGEPFSVAVSNLSHEAKLNEDKRKIKILRYNYLDQLLSEYKTELKTKN